MIPRRKDEKRLMTSTFWKLRRIDLGDQWVGWFEDNGSGSTFYFTDGQSTRFESNNPLFDDRPIHFSHARRYRFDVSSKLSNDARLFLPTLNRLEGIEQRTRVRQLPRARFESWKDDWPPGESSSREAGGAQSSCCNSGGRFGEAELSRIFRRLFSYPFFFSPFFVFKARARVWNGFLASTTNYFKKRKSFFRTLSTSVQNGDRETIEVFYSKVVLWCKV